jgi:hypothetical protein
VGRREVFRVGDGRLPVLALLLVVMAVSNVGLPDDQGDEEEEEEDERKAVVAKEASHLAHLTN